MTVKSNTNVVAIVILAAFLGECKAFSVSTHLPTITTTTHVKSSISRKRSDNFWRRNEIQERIHLNSMVEDDTGISDTISANNNTVPVDQHTNNDEDSHQEQSSQQMVASSGQQKQPPNNNIFSKLFQNALGFEPTADIVAIATIYFIEGALGLSQLAKTFLLKEELHLDPAELSALSGIFVLPWTIKPLYGFLSDGVPLFNYKRRSYLILAGLIGCLSYTALGNDFWGVFSSSSLTATVGPSTSSSDAVVSPLMIQATVVSLMLSSACIAFSDVVADGIVVQKTREHAEDDPALAGGLQSLCWGSAALGGILSAYYSGSLLEVMSPQKVFQITAVLPLIVASIAFLIDEQPVTSTTRPQKQQQTQADSLNQPRLINGDGIMNEGTSNGANGYSSKTINDTATNFIEADPSSLTISENDSMKTQLATLWEAFRQPSIWKPTLFLFLWQSTPTSDGAFLYFMTDELGFGPEFLGRVRLVTAAASLVGVWVYNSFLKKVAIKDILFWSSIVALPLGLSSLLLITHTNRALGIPDSAFLIGDDVALAILGEVRGIVVHSIIYLISWCN